MLIQVGEHMHNMYLELVIAAAVCAALYLVFIAVHGCASACRQMAIWISIGYVAMARTRTIATGECSKATANNGRVYSPHVYRGMHDYGTVYRTSLGSVQCFGNVELYNF